MAQWIAFILMIGIPAVWYFVGNGSKPPVIQEVLHPAEFFRIASAELELATGPDALEQALTALETFWSTHEHVPADVQTELKTATAEVMANILEHGDAEKVRIGMNLSPNRVQIDFTDDGSPVAVDLESVAMPDPLAERGRGLALTKASLSQLFYEREQSGNHWTLVSNMFDRARSVANARG